jgi:hypothetical protein
MKYTLTVYVDGRVLTVECEGFEVNATGSVRCYDRSYSTVFVAAGTFAFSVN